MLPPSSFASHALQLLQNVQRGISPVELVYTAHERWPFRPGQSIHVRPTLHISVLDASFNPPTLAHLALANSPPPSTQRSATSVASYDARMLLLSVRNADKVLKPGDPTLLQRLEMMRLLSPDIRVTDTAESGGEPERLSGNVAIAIIDEPTFVGKSAHLLRFLQARLATVAELLPDSSGMSNERLDTNKRDASCPFPSPKLTFLLGLDTLVRVFLPKYYPSEQAMVDMLWSFLSPDQEDCRIVCALRQSIDDDKTFQGARDGMFEIAREFIASERIAFTDIGSEAQAYSSSEVRTKVAAQDRTWKQLVTGTIANYIIKERIYFNSEREQ